MGGEESAESLGGASSRRLTSQTPLPRPSPPRLPSHQPGRPDERLSGVKQRAPLTSSITPPQKILAPSPLHLSVQSVVGEWKRGKGERERERGDGVASEPGRSKELEERETLPSQFILAALLLSLYVCLAFFFSVFFVVVSGSVCSSGRGSGTKSQGGRVKLAEFG